MQLLLVIYSILTAVQTCLSTSIAILTTCSTATKCQSSWQRYPNRWADKIFSFLITYILSLLQVEGKGNGIKTVIANMSEIAKALNRPPSCEFLLIYSCTMGYTCTIVLINLHKNFLSMFLLLHIVLCWIRITTRNIFSFSDPTKYFGCELGAQTLFDAKNDRYIVNGEHDAGKLQSLLDGFIKKFVLCQGCENPETTLVRNMTCSFSFSKFLSLEFQNF